MRGHGAADLNGVARAATKFEGRTSAAVEDPAESLRLGELIQVGGSERVSSFGLEDVRPWVPA